MIAHHDKERKKEKAPSFFDARTLKLKTVLWAFLIFADQ